MIPLRDANPTRRVPIVTIALIALCCAAYAYELATQATGGEAALDRLFFRYGLIPAELTSSLGGGPEGRTSVGLLSVVTSLFLHGGWVHLLGNMLYLWIFGNNIEDRFGRVRFVAFYLVGGAAAAVSQVLISPDSDVPVIGASGAIAAILGAYLVLYPRARVLSLVFLGFFYQLLQVPAVIVLGLWFGLQLIDGVASLGGSASSGGVALFAHIGGFLTGVATALIVRTAGGWGGPRPAGSRRAGPPDGFDVG